MIILGIETSCDDTAISVIVGSGGLRRPKFKVLAHVVSSQTAIHAPWGGVVPNLAKREHSKNLIPVLKEALAKAKLIKTHKAKATPWGPKGVALNFKVAPLEKEMGKILAREPELLKRFLEFIPTITVPKIDAIAVTVGPGLEPALWTGINLARALVEVWQKKLIPINHIEGHIVSVLADGKSQGLSLGRGLKDSPLSKASPFIKFPVLALIISGGHTELVVMRDWFEYKIIGQTRDDAVGETFDKVARLLSLPYPGGPAISKLAEKFHQGKNQGATLHLSLKVTPSPNQGETLRPRSKASPFDIKLPRPMIDSPDFDFSFSGLKTAVLYLLQKIKDYPWDPLKGSPLESSLRGEIAHEFQQAAIDVLLAKTIKAIDEYQPKTLIVAGGVSANQELRRRFIDALARHQSNVQLLFPTPPLSVDNATMIAMAGYLRLNRKQGETLHPSLKVSPLGNTTSPRQVKVSPLKADGCLVLK